MRKRKYPEYAYYRGKRWFRKQTVSRTCKAKARFSLSGRPKLFESTLRGGFVKISREYSTTWIQYLFFVVVLQFSQTVEICFQHFFFHRYFLFVPIALQWISRNDENPPPSRLIWSFGAARRCLIDSAALPIHIYILWTSQKLRKHCAHTLRRFTRPSQKTISLPRRERSLFFATFFYLFIIHTFRRFFLTAARWLGVFRTPFFCTLSYLTDRLLHVIPTQTISVSHTPRTHAHLARLYRAGRRHREWRK